MPERGNPRDAHDGRKVRRYRARRKMPADSIAKPARAVASAIQRAKKRGMKSSPNAPANVM